MPIWYRRLANAPEKSAVPDGYDFPVSSFRTSAAPAARPRSFWLHM